MKGAYKWQNIKHLSAIDLANLIREHEIDILVDLSLHSGNNRLPTFALRPAPIQMTYLAYASTTGMKTMDYRISDSYIDPPEDISIFYSEKTLYITSYWCYSPPALKEPIEVNELPALKTGFVTFGSQNNVCKVSNAAINMWARLLKEIPNSRLLISCPEGRHRSSFIDKFKDVGIEHSRIDLVGRQGFNKYFELYHNIDICLDPFPFGGGITTCDAMYMGVPTISLKGATAVGRGGASILSNTGLHGLIANSEEEYISIAKKLASDLQWLAATRKGLRERLQQSPVMDGKRFADEIGAIFRQAWIRHCGLEK
jgi:predicted O-linked N-acetylglucosamine transferase (SPINDLY family)